MNSYNRRLAENLVEALDHFVAGGLDLDEIQCQLQTAVQLFENEPDAPVRATDLAEEDLEDISVARLAEEQRSAAIFRLDELRVILVGALAGQTN